MKELFDKTAANESVSTEYSITESNEKIQTLHPLTKILEFWEFWNFYNVLNRTF